MKEVGKVVAWLWREPERLGPFLKGSVSRTRDSTDPFSILVGTLCVNSTDPLAIFVDACNRDIFIYWTRRQQQERVPRRRRIERCWAIGLVDRGDARGRLPAAQHVIVEGLVQGAHHILRVRS